jgi:SAM-dependent methyltransferase
VSAVADVTADPFYERDLEQMARAPSYLAWQFSLIRPFISGEVVEVGAGIGNFTGRIAACAAHVTTLEPNTYCFDRLTSATSALKNVTRYNLTVEEYHRLVRRALADTIVCVNVLEHIEDDAAVVREFRSLISPGGRLVLQVPAMPIAFGEIDRRLGHYRRYTKGLIRRLLDATGWRTVHLRYFNTVGLLGWLWNTKVAIKTAQSDQQIRVFDRWVVPVLSTLEAILPPPFGQCLFAVAVADA